MSDDYIQLPDSKIISEEESQALIESMEGYVWPGPEPEPPA